MSKRKIGFSPTRLLVAISLCIASLAAAPAPALAACQAGEAGCVLPVGEAPPPVATPTTPPPFDEPRGGFGGWGWIAFLAALAGLAALLLFVLDDDDEDAPVSP